eukprot:183524_1
MTVTRCWLLIVFLACWLRTLHAQNACVSSTELTVCINDEPSSKQYGNICSISTKYGLNMTTNGSSWLGDTKRPDVLNIQVVSDTTIVTITKNITIYTVVSSYEAKLVETISIYESDSSVIQWVVNIIPNTQEIFRTNISTEMKILNEENNSDLYFWAMKTDTINDNNWKDPMDLFDSNQILSLQLGDGYMSFGGISNNNPITLFPLHVILSKKNNNGIAFIYDLNDVIFGASLDISSTSSLFQRYFNKISTNNKYLNFRTFIRVNKGFNVRDTLNWTVEQYPDLFYPISRKYGKMPIALNEAGMGSYSCANAQDINATNFVSESGGNINWISSQYEPYFGMWNPPLAYNETWITNNGYHDQMNCGTYHHSTNLSFQMLNEKLINMKNIGIYDLFYFNVFEYGQNVKWPLDKNTNGPNKNTWKNASEFLWFYLNNSLAMNSKYEPVGEWQNGILLDPNPDTLWGKWLLNQTLGRVEIFGENFQGFSFDRQDHTREYNYNSSDEKSLCFNNGKKSYVECKSLLTSWKDLAKQITNVIHNGSYVKNEGVITLNMNGGMRMDLNMLSDITFSEGYDVNGIGFASLMRPAILWTYNSNELIGVGTHVYFQRSLYMKVNLMAPCIGNDHSILPDSNIQKYYNMYGNLFKQLRGTIWWLNVDTVEIIFNDKYEDNMPLINSFVKSGYTNVVNEFIFVLVLGDMNVTQVVDIEITGVNKISNCSYITPNNNQNWKPLMLSNNTIVNNITLEYGCAVVKCLP